MFNDSQTYKLNSMLEMMNPKTNYTKIHDLLNNGYKASNLYKGRLGHIFIEFLNSDKAIASAIIDQDFLKELLSNSTDNKIRAMIDKGYKVVYCGLSSNALNVHMEDKFGGTLTETVSGKKLISDITNRFK
jgi:hypothetical protein